MQLGLPDNYPSACALPFNRESLEQQFQLSTPDQDPGGEGDWLLLQGQSLVTSNDPQAPQLPTELPPELSERPALYIGHRLGRPCRLLMLKKEDPLPADSMLHPLQANNPQIPLPLLSLAGVALMINHWEQSSRFCGYCGGQLARLKLEWGKKCRQCGKAHFPRIHPCVIGLIVRNDEILLVRKPEWVKGRYGLVAGFVEFGESLEQAMSREIMEETGIAVDNLRYIGSQCWPFPSQIMHGFVCDYVDGDIKLQENELEDGGWYRLDNLPTLPPRRSIARYLIDSASDYIF